MEAKAAKWKKDEIVEIKELISKFQAFGLVNMQNIPALQLQRMKKKLNEKMKIRMAKKSLIDITLNDLGKEERIKHVNRIREAVVGMPALVFTNEDPMKLSKILRKNKSTAPAKSGQMAPNDLIVRAGGTSFAPGPIIGELGQFGIKTEVQEGKVAITEEKLLVKEGEEISQKQADLMSKLGMEPMEIGLKLLITYKDGEILSKEVLDIDEQEYIDNLILYYQQAFNLAVNIGIVNRETISFLIRKASNEFNSLSNLDKLKSLEVAVEVKEEPKEEKVEIIEKPKEEKVEKKQEITEEPKEESQEEIMEEPKVEESEVKEEPEENKKEVKEEPKEQPKEVSGNKEVNTEDLVKEVEESSEDEKKEKEYMKEVEDITKNIMWGEDK